MLKLKKRIHIFHLICTSFTSGRFNLIPSNRECVKMFEETLTCVGHLQIVSKYLKTFSSGSSCRLAYQWWLKNIPIMGINKPRLNTPLLIRRHTFRIIQLKTRWLPEFQHKYWLECNGACKIRCRFHCLCNNNIRVEEFFIIITRNESSFWIHYLIRDFIKYFLLLLLSTGGCPRGVMVKAMNCGIVVREFVL